MRSRQRILRSPMLNETPAYTKCSFRDTKTITAVLVSFVGIIVKLENVCPPLSSFNPCPSLLCPLQQMTAGNTFSA